MNPRPSRNPIPMIGIIVCCILAGIAPALAADGTAEQPAVGGTIDIKSYPLGAGVYLNDDFRGVTPLMLRNVTPGTYVINISLAGYRNETFRTTIYNGSTREYGVNLENASSAAPSPAPAGTGSIAIDSTPGGATVSLDGNPVGKTPAGRAALILNAVPAGIHTVTVDLAGYPRYTGTVTVIKNQVARVNAEFRTESPAIPGTPPATMSRGEAVPLSPLTALAAAGLAGLAAAFRRS